MSKIKRIIMCPEKINFRCSEKEKELVIKGAERNNISCSEYIRMLIRKDAE